MEQASHLLAGREVALRENRLPAPPNILSVKVKTSTKVEIRWKKSPAEETITSYKVYHKTTGAWSLLATVAPAFAHPTRP